MRFAVYLTTIATLMVRQSDSTRLSAELDAYGEGDMESDVHTEVEVFTEAEVDALVQAEVDADAKIAAQAHAEAENFITDKISHWSEDAKKGIADLMSIAKGEHGTTVSKMISGSLKGESVW